MKKYLIFATIALLAGAEAFAQTPIDRLRAMMSNEAVELKCSYEVALSGTKVTGVSDILIQGSRYFLSGNGLEVFCNGDDIWTVDYSTKEVIIEQISDEMESYVANPLLLLNELDKYFAVTGKTNRPGLTEYSLEAVRSCGVKKATVQISEGGIIKSGSFALDDGNILDFKVTGFKPVPSRPESDFRPQVSFDSSWVVTDLR